MNRYLILTATILAMTACQEEKSPVPSLVIADIKQASLDVVYATQDALMQSNMSLLDSGVEKMQKVLNAWPEEMKNNQQPCYMLLKNETTRLLNLKEGIATPKSDDDFKYECRQSISYVYDKQRTHEFWKGL